MIAPVVASIDKPAGALNVPPAVAVCVTGCAVVTVVQNGLPAYEMVPEGAAVMVTVVVAENAPHPPAGGTVYVTV